MNYSDGRIDTFANRLAIAMTKENLNQIQLSARTKLFGKYISQSLINKYLKGKAFARQNNIYVLCKSLNVNEAWLMGFDVPATRSFGHTNVAEIDVISLMTNEVIQKIPFLYRTDIADEDPNHFFAIYVSDNSMSPLLDEGDIAIIKKYKHFISNKTYLLRIKGGSPVIRKVIQTDNKKLELQAMNMWNFPPQRNIDMKDIEFLGQVVKAENNSAFK